MRKCAVVTVRYASGGVEYWYEAAVPKVGDRVGRDESGFVTSVELEGADRATVLVGTKAPDFVAWEDLAPAEAADTRRPGRARERILEAAYELFSRRGIRAVGTEEIIERATPACATISSVPTARIPRREKSS